MPDLEGRGFKIALDRHGARVDPDTQSRIVTEEAAEEVAEEACFEAATSGATAMITNMQTASTHARTACTEK